jgi:hypothetical protein
MKRTILLFAIITSGFALFSQDLERKYLINLTGGYNKRSDDISYGGTSNETKTIVGKAQIGIYYKLNSFLYFGVGFEYQKWKEESDNGYYYHDDNNNNTFIFYVNPSVERVALLPSLNFKLWQNITNKFFVGLNIINAYGFITMKEKYTAIMAVDNPVDFLHITTLYNDEYDKTCYTFILEPELMYYFSDRLGLTVQIDFFKFDTIDKGQFFFATKSNDVFWSIGLNFGIH